jgi:hypothetical protein
MNSSDGMSSNVGICIVAFVSVDGNGGMWIIDGVIASLSFVGMQLADLQVFRCLQEEKTERLSLFHPSNMFESVVVVVVAASMLNINFFIMIEKNTYII